MMYSVEKIEAVLSVASLEETAKWYERVLGWSAHFDTFDAEGRCLFGSVMRGDVESVLRDDTPFAGFNLIRFSGDPNSYSKECANFTALIAVDDIDAVYSRARNSGVALDSEPEDQLWGGRTFTMRDMNGFNLTFYEMVESVTVEEIRRRYEQARK
jgi:uncharacterized glyoxalase superfamily protein PhnB